MADVVVETTVYKPNLNLIDDADWTDDAPSIVIAGLTRNPIALMSTCGRRSPSAILTGLRVKPAMTVF